MARRCSTIRAVGLVLLMSVGMLLDHHPAQGQATEWRVGDVFLAVGDGTYHVYDRAGQFTITIARKGDGK